MVLGAALANDLFVQESPVGQTIFIGEWPFLVVGVLEWVGDPVAVQVPAGARPHISMLTALMALSLLTLVGLVSGVWPAKRVAAVFPAEALRAD